ncbi:MAG: hypothetical protein JRJ03_18815 [Deltaproteobacteria bacterium]|nr:hypothetical protein [Deltaproteobacteria bacterium]
MARKMACAVLLSLFTVTLLMFLPAEQWAEAAYPEKPITFIVPFGAGGGFDGMARALAPRLEKELGVPFPVKNEKGSGGRRGSITYLYILLSCC